MTDSVCLWRAREAIRNDQSVFLFLLSKRSEKEQYGFLYTLFSSYEGSPKENDLEKCLGNLVKLKETHPTLYKNMKKAVKDLKILALEHTR
jgi:hypothetical protein